MNFSDDWIYAEIYKHINRTILDGNVMNVSLIVLEGNYGAIHTDDYSCHGYYWGGFHKQSNINLLRTIAHSCTGVKRGDRHVRVDQRRQDLVDVK